MFNLHLGYQCQLDIKESNIYLPIDLSRTLTLRLTDASFSLFAGGSWVE